MNQRFDLETVGYKDDDGAHHWSYYIYPDGNDTKYYFIMISGSDEDLKPQVISSIEWE